MVMEIEKLYFSFDQLAAHWAIPLEDVLQLALTNQLKIIAQADWEYPAAQVIQRGAHTPINVEEVANIFYAQEPFTLVGFADNSHDGILRGDQCNITFYPGLSRLIVDATEVKRFEGGQSQVKEKAVIMKKMQDYKDRDKDAALWLSDVKPDIGTMTISEIKNTLKIRNNSLWGKGFEGWNRQQTVWPKKTKGRKPCK
ncbi:MAG: hypothetical protein WCP01_16945 [Methylococcaceae bacterium]